MKCRYCGAKIEDDSIFCRYCGERVARQRRKAAGEAREISVPRPNQLASGEYTAQVMINGRRESVKGRTEAEYYEKARALKAGLLAVKERRNMTLTAAIDLFLQTHSELLSKSTIKAYKSLQKNRFQECMSWNVYEPQDWQGAINREMQKGLNARSVKNAWSLICKGFAAAGMEAPRVDLPRHIRKTRSEKAYLDYQQIGLFLSAIRGDPCELAALLALHSCRLSELLGITGERVDLAGDLVQIRGARVIGEDGLVFQELNKEDASRRDIPILIPRLRELLKGATGEDYIVKQTGRQIYSHVNKACRVAGVPEVGVHGLRHSFASLAYHLGWKMLSVKEVGGWADSKVVEEIYTHNADLDRDIKAMRKHYKRKT
jgi:integrase